MFSSSNLIIVKISSRRLHPKFDDPPSQIFTQSFDFQKVLFIFNHLRQQLVIWKVIVILMLNIIFSLFLLRYLKHVVVFTKLPKTLSSEEDTSIIFAYPINTSWWNTSWWSTSYPNKWKRLNYLDWELDYCPPLCRIQWFCSEEAILLEAKTFCCCLEIRPSKIIKKKWLYFHTIFPLNGYIKPSD